MFAETQNNDQKIKVKPIKPFRGANQMKILLPFVFIIVFINHSNANTKNSTDTLKYRVAVYAGQEFNPDSAKEVPYSTVRIKVNTPSVEGYNNYIFLSTPADFGKPTILDEFGLDISDMFTSIGEDESEGFHSNTIWKHEQIIYPRYVKKLILNLNNSQATEECQLDMGNYRLAIYTGREYDADDATEIEYSTGTITVNSPTVEGYNYVFFSTPKILGKPIFRDDMGSDISYQINYFGHDNKEGYLTNIVWKLEGVFSTVYSTRFSITLNNFYENNDTIKICQGESYKGWTESGYYVENLVSKDGCDSIVKTNLTVCPDSIIEITSTTGDTLKANGNYQSYQWYDMEGKIEDATFNEFVIEKSGTYYVEVIDDNGCSFSSNEISMVKTGFEKLQNEEFKIMVLPNPNNGQFRLRLENAKQGSCHITIFTEEGQNLFHKTVTIISNMFEENINAQSLPKGNYIIHVKNHSVIKSQKIIIK